MKLEYCIDCGYPLEEYTICPGCNREVRQLVPLTMPQYQTFNESVIKSFEKGKVSLLDILDKKKIIKGMQNGTIKYAKVMISAMYDSSESDYEKHRKCISLRDMDDNPLEKDIYITKRGPEHLKLQKEYSSKLKNTEAVLIQFSEYHYYVFLATDDTSFGLAIAQNLGDICSQASSTRARKVHKPRTDLLGERTYYSGKLGDVFRDELVTTSKMEEEVKVALLNGVDTMVEKIIDNISED